MKVLVIGGGGREHALIWKLLQSKRVNEVHCAPGNGGISKIATCIGLKATDIDGLTAYAKEQAFDLVVVAPDDPLAMGLVDELEANGIRAFGPNKAAARIEASKVFSKDLMKKYGIPTAQYEVFSDYDAALNYLSKQSMPVVLKADGLALGKGVLICETMEDAVSGLRKIMVEKAFGDAGLRVVIEEFIQGPEVSLLLFSDGKCYKEMLSAQDHKRALDGDKGLNTGGMGAFAPSPKYTDSVAEYVREKIAVPTLRAMEAEGCTFKGVLYIGLMLTEDGPKVLEYNARFGDPEAQAILPLLKTDLADVMEAVIDERLNEIELDWEEGFAVCVVAASGGYPGSYGVNKPISGLDENIPALIFHAGTKKSGDGNIVTSGGRVLNVTAKGRDIEDAREKAYASITRISFDGMHYRKDIGIK